MKRVLVWAALFVAVAATAGSTTVEDLTLARALELSSDVVVGVVVDAETLESPSGTIFTHWTVMVEQVLKGDAAAGEPLVIRHWGGTLGEFTLHVEGVPSFTPDEKVLLFLTHWRNSELRRTLGVFQGAYTIVEQDGDTWAIQKPRHETLVVRLQPVDKRLPLRAPLQAFLEAIRAQGVRR